MKNRELKAAIYQIKQRKKQYQAVERFISEMKKITPSASGRYYGYRNFNRDALHGSITNKQLQEIIKLFFSGVKSRKNLPVWSNDIEPYNLIADTLIQYHCEELTDFQKVSLAAKSLSPVTYARVVRSLDGNLSDDPTWDNFARQLFKVYTGNDKIRIPIRQLKLAFSDNYKNVTKSYYYRSELPKRLQYLKMPKEDVRELWNDKVLSLNKDTISQIGLQLLGNPDIELDRQLIKDIAAHLHAPLKSFNQHRPDLMENSLIRDDVLIEHISSLTTYPSIQKYLKQISNASGLVSMLTHKNAKVREFIKGKLNLNETSAKDLEKIQGILESSEFPGLDWEEELGEETYEQLSNLEVNDDKIIGLQEDEEEPEILV